MADFERPFRVVEGGINGPFPKEESDPTKDDLLVLIRWLLRNDPRMKSDQEYPTSVEAYAKADLGITDVYILLHRLYAQDGNNVSVMRSLVCYARKSLLPDAERDAGEIVREVTRD